MKRLILLLPLLLLSCYWTPEPAIEFVAEYGGYNNLGDPQEFWTFQLNGGIYITSGPEYREEMEPPISAQCGFDGVWLKIEKGGDVVAAERYQLHYE